MGNAPSALHQAVLSGDLARCRVAVQEHPSEIDNAEPGVGYACNCTVRLHYSNAWLLACMHKQVSVACTDLVNRSYQHQHSATLQLQMLLTDVCLQNGWTGLHIASAKGYDYIVRELLARGANPHVADKVRLEGAADVGRVWCSESNST